MQLLFVTDMHVTLSSLDCSLAWGWLERTHVHMHIVLVWYVYVRLCKVMNTCCAWLFLVLVGVSEWVKEKGRGRERERGRERREWEREGVCVCVHECVCVGCYRQVHKKNNSIVNIMENVCFEQVIKIILTIRNSFSWHKKFRFLCQWAQKFLILSILFSW